MDLLDRRPRLIAGVFAVVLVGSIANADTTKRVVLADPDPELRRAVDVSLRPWRIEIIIDPTAPTDVASAQARADDRAARFVVWRDGAELVVFDRESLQTERRAVRVGALDPLGADAAALSIKTMMRLPPPLVIGDTPIASPSLTRDGIEIRIEAGLGSRFEQGLDSNVALRFTAGAMVRPWRERGWRFGVVGDFGASATVEQAGFKGTWTNWAALGLASWTLPVEAWELEPWGAIGVERSSLDGTEMGAARTEHTTLPAVRGGLAARRRIGMWSIGAIVAVETVVGAPTYTKVNSPAQVFEVPPFGVVGSVVVATDLTP